LFAHPISLSFSSGLKCLPQVGWASGGPQV
jgi:hypothetical protein